ncbi:unnamed protein product [Malus baccata var. baccata]
MRELLTGVVSYTELCAKAQAHTVLEMNYKEQQLTAAVVSDGLRPVLADPESGVPSTLLSLILRCWDANSQNMPSFDVIVTELAIILEQGKKRKEPDISFHDSLNSLGNQPRDVANNLEAYQEGLVNLSMVWKCGFGLQMILWHIILCFLGDPLLHVAEGRPWRTHISFSHTCAAAAEFSARAFPGFLQAISSISSPSSALFEAFVKTNTVFRAEVGLYRKSKRVIPEGLAPWLHCGCCSYCLKQTFFVANAGDCRTIACGAGLATPLF